MLTSRDRQYMRALFLLRANNRFVGPQELADKMGVTKVCSFQKMRRLEVLGYGDYMVRKGLRLNEAGVKAVEEEIRRHHMLERFLSKTLEMSEEEACDHSSHMGPFICEGVMKVISERYGHEIQCECGHCLHECNGHQGGQACHWLKKGI